ncbi:MULTISPECIES: PPC domain-containing DNA-binding protein [Bacteroides]|uniref:PPC domain-containing DNA-binding protein n=1 Tax=Bacteroides TaxID=816 RepID=UPI001DB86900|nr:MULTISPECIES: PPC domain-containing DNA-binding protein [Bacteroides]HJD91324.1 DNA-binding protein [Bacteroides coprosuis]
MYSYKKIGNRFIVSLKNGTEIVKALQLFCKEMNIRSGIIAGIGSIDEIRLRFFDAKTKQYSSQQFQEQMEIANLMGNISTYNKDIYLHIHITLGRSDYSAIAGHLLSATISGTGEFLVEDFDADMMRYYNSELGVNYYDFE